MDLYLTLLMPFYYLELEYNYSHLQLQYIDRIKIYTVRTWSLQYVSHVKLKAGRPALAHHIIVCAPPDVIMLKVLTMLICLDY